MTRAWVFKEFRPGDTQKDPISGAFFQQNALQDTAEALVRESVQNSLDATPKGQNTKVRFRVIRDIGRQNRMSAREWVSELAPHVAATDNGLRGVGDLDSLEPIIVIEDFGTRGLVGDPEAYQSEESVRNDFFAFFRAEGFHQKSAESLGKWGVGKTVFPRSSRMNMFFGYSIRADDPQPLLLGRAIFKTHTASGKKWHPDGYLGVRRGDGLVLPFREDNDLEEFRSTFDLERTTEPGLSVVVPFADPDIDESHLLKAAIHDYFVPLLEGRLSVHIVGDDPLDQWVVDNTTLDTIIAEQGDLFSELDRARVETAKWALGDGMREIEALAAPPASRVPALGDGLLPQVQLERLRRHMASGSPFAVRQPFYIQPKNGPAELATIDVFFQSAAVGHYIRPTFVRNVLVSGPAAEFVGASENVAHTEWNQAREGFKDAYKYAAGTLKFIKNYPADLLSYLRTSDVDEDADLLNKVFFLDMEADPDLDEGDGDDGRDTKPTKRKVTPGPGEGPGSRTRYSITSREGGFSVSQGTRTEGFDGELRIRAAYGMRNKNPLGAYANTDFDFADGSLTIDTSGSVSLVSARGNEMVLLVGAGDFTCTVVGFDVERDLFVKADVVREASVDDNA
jgi:hypothetical protein